MKAPADRHFVTALARGLDVLACFRTGEATLGNQELAQRCGLPKSTVSRLTHTLARLGFLIQLPDCGRFRLGTACLALGSAMLAWPALKRGIERARIDHAELGVTRSFGEWQPEVNGIARAFQPGNGLPAMAVNVGGAAFQLTPSHLMNDLRPRLIEMVARLEEALPQG